VWTGLQYQEFKESFPFREKWKLNATSPPDDEVLLQLQRIENEMKSSGKTMISSEAMFIPRSILHEWIVKGNPFYSKLFQKWSFLTTLRDPVKRLESSFYFHDDHFHVCREKKYGLGRCIENTSIFSEGMNRNKLVKELSGFYAPTETGTLSGRFNGAIPVEATNWDLTVAKLVLHRFLPPIFADTIDAMQNTMNNTFSFLNLTKQPTVPQKNVGKNKKLEMTNATIKAIETLNAFDIELYKYALSSFDIAVGGNDPMT
jgi:hypothetical protein